MATSVNFSAEAEEGDTSCVTISITDDDVTEDDEDFSICVAAGADILVQEGRDTQTVTILDDDRTLLVLRTCTVYFFYSTIFPLLQLYL